MPHNDEKRVLFLAVVAVAVLRLLAWGAGVEPARADSSVNQTIPTMTPTGRPGPGPTTQPTGRPGPTDEATRLPGENVTPVEPLPGTSTPLPGIPSSPAPAPTFGPGPTDSLPPAGDTPAAIAPVGPVSTPDVLSSAPPPLSPVEPGAAPAVEAQTPAPVRPPAGQASAPAAIAAGNPLPLLCLWPALGVVLLAAGVGLLVVQRRRTT